MASFSQSSHSEVLSKGPDTWLALNEYLLKCIHLIWFDLICWTKSWLLSLGHGSFISVSLLKSSKLRLRLLIWLRLKRLYHPDQAVSCAATKSIDPVPFLKAEWIKTAMQASALLLHIYLWWPQNTGLAVVSLLRLDINPEHTPGKTKVGMLLRGMPSAWPTAMLNIHCSL